MSELKRKRRILFKYWSQQKNLEDSKKEMPATGRGWTEESGWFHEWGIVSEVEYSNDSSSFATTNTVGICENDDGEIHLVHPTYIKFK